jgi:hypothetical protein
VGLLQGPPGTGKTKFIAAFAHWLATDRKAERILIASQSHEAVNNVIEAVLRTFRGFGHRPNLLRIGSKNITAAVKPYHTASVRERYGVSFSNSIRSRVSSLASSLGIDRRFAQAAVDLDRQAGSLARRYQYLLEEIGRGGHRSEDERRLNAALRTVRKAFAAIMQAAGIEELSPENPAGTLGLAFESLREERGVTRQGAPRHRRRRQDVEQSGEEEPDAARAGIRPRYAVRQDRKSGVVVMTDSSDKSDRILVDAVGFRIPCRRFSFVLNVSRDRRLPVVDEFVLRLLRMFERIPVQRLRTFFGFSVREMEIVLSDLVARGHVLLEGEFASLQPAADELFSSSADGMPRMVSVETWNETVSFDMVASTILPSERSYGSRHLIEVTPSALSKEVPRRFAEEAFTSNFRDFVRNNKGTGDADSIHL